MLQHTFTMSAAIGARLRRGTAACGTVALGVSAAFGGVALTRG